MEQQAQAIKAEAAPWEFPWLCSCGAGGLEFESYDSQRAFENHKACQGDKDNHQREAK